jgi:ribonuclease J
LLRYLPLGGLGEVGVNMWALEWEDQLLVVDAGLMFPHEDMLGVDLVIPDVSYLLEPGRKVLGIFLTHGHEDHVGGLPFVLKRLNVPVYGTRLTLGLLEVRVGDRVQLGPFRVETIAVCHSIPDGVALAVDTPAGKVVYTSDFKIDPQPPDGRPTDLERFRRLGEEGVTLLLSDSTNSERAGRSGSERDLHPAFEEIFESAPGRLVVATFASNIHRIQHVVRLAAAAGRKLAVVGRSLQNNFKTAQELGFLEVPSGLTVNLEKASGEPRLVLLAAGSQGEPLSALARFAALRHPVVNVERGDWVIISARPIPGNERLVHQTINNLYRNGARVFYSDTDHVHVSGHAHRDELREMLDLVRPRYFIPVHGEYRQLMHHAELAQQAGIPPENVFIVEDGQTVAIDAGGARLGDKIPAGFVYVDGIGIGDVMQVVLRDRRRLSQDGILVVTIAVDRDTGAVRAGPELVSRGFMEEDLSAELLADAREAALQGIQRMSGSRPEPQLLQESVHDSVLKLIHKRTKRRPMIIPVITEL